MALLVVGTAIPLLFCGGCGAFLGGSGAIVNEAREAARLEQQKRDAEKAATPEPSGAEQPADVSAPVSPPDSEPIEPTR